jgi:broad specificity phosphatase PhoE
MTDGDNPAGNRPGLRLYLIRHGQTESNVHKLLDSAPPGPPLNELGQQQALELAEELADEPIVAIHASAATRAQQTAATLADKHGLPVQVVRGTHEVSVGDLEGRGDEESVRRFFEVFHHWNGGDLDVPMPGGETGRQAVDRFRNAVQEVCAPHQEGIVVLVAHGAIIRLASVALAANLSAEAVEKALIPNVGRVELTRDPGSPSGWRCDRWPGVEAFD